MSSRTIHVQILPAKRANSSCLVLRSIFRFTWWRSTARRCHRAIRKTPVASMLRSNSRPRALTCAVEGVQVVVVVVGQDMSEDSAILNLSRCRPHVQYLVRKTVAVSLAHI